MSWGPSCKRTPPTCNDNDSDGYGDPGDVSCAKGLSRDCNGSNGSINPGAVENCTDGIDNDCDDNACNGDPACWAKSCNEYTGRINCKTSPLCNWRGKDKSCSEIVGIIAAQKYNVQ